MKLPLTGIIPPMITPLHGRDELDVPGLERLVERILLGGVSGLFVLGTTGEGPSLSYRLRRELVERVGEQVNHRVRVLVGITDAAFEESVAMARHAAEAGADAVVLAPPYYPPHSQSELIDWLEHLLPEIPLPLVLYNLPAVGQVSFAPETVRRVLQDPRIVGIKDSSGDPANFRRLRELLPARRDWTLLVGPEEMLAEALLAGAHGGVSGGANLFPRLYVALVNAVQSNDLSRVQELNAVVLRVGETLYRVGGHTAALIAGLKCGLACVGVCEDVMAEPFRPYAGADRVRIERVVAELAAELERLGL